jgi:hypothetical protein
MSFLVRTLLLVCVILLFSTLAAAQGSVGGVISVGSGTSMGPLSKCAITRGPLFATTPAGPSAPYSAVRENSTQQTLADGTHISQTHPTEKIYRDSQGRTRMEWPICGRLGEVNAETRDDPEAVLVEIHDPVAGYAYILDAQGHVVHRYVLKEFGTASRLASGGEKVQVARSGAAAEVPPGPHVEAPATAAAERRVTRGEEESLGSETMEGLLVEGARTTTTIPVGKAGNDRPLTIVRENWFSPLLQMSILTKTTDPRFGEHITRLTNIDTSEPSPLLFQVPPDYKVVDETEAVRITYEKR